MTFHITWGSIQEWGYNQADTVTQFSVVLLLLTWSIIICNTKISIIYSKVKSSADFSTFHFF